MNVTALPTRTDAMQGKTVTTYTLAAGAEKTLEVAADCKIETFEGDFNGDMSSPAEGSLADVQVSTDSEIYVVEYQVEEDVYKRQQKSSAFWRMCTTGIRMTGRAAGILR